jgi:hypothetical protein
MEWNGKVQEVLKAGHLNLLNMFALSPPTSFFSSRQGKSNRFNCAQILWAKNPSSKAEMFY